MDDEEYFGPAQDIMSLRAGMMAHLAAQVEDATNATAKKLLLSAMECLLFTISPPRGEVVEMKH